MNVFISEMGDYLVKATTVRNERPVCQTRKSLVNNKLSNDKPVQNLDGWPLSQSNYCKKPEVCVPDEEKLSG